MSKEPYPEDYPAPEEGVLVTVFLVVEDMDRSRDFYRDVLGARVVRERNPAVLRFHNSWLILNVGGGPTEDKPDVELTVPRDPRVASSALNLRVADVHEVYRIWSDRGAHFLTPPMDRGNEIRCYLHDPDGHLIEVGQPTEPKPEG